jgi:SAM-dependent methyltransferase
MRKCESGPQLRQSLRAWFGSPLGRSLLASETNQLQTVLPRLYGLVTLQLGSLGKMDMMEGCHTPTRVVLDLLRNGETTTVQGVPEAIPFDTRSVDVALLPHTLDFSDDPHQVLREVDRILVPEGHVVILGFNPLSFWGLRRTFATPRGHVPWCGNFLRLARLKDWLRLLEYELMGGRMMYYRPPLQNDRLMNRLYFLDAVGDRWWPMMAAAYIVVAKKRVFGVTRLRARWRRKSVIRPGLSEPVVRGIQRHG